MLRGLWYLGWRFYCFVFCGFLAVLIMAWQRQWEIHDAIPTGQRATVLVSWRSWVRVQLGIQATQVKGKQNVMICVARYTN